jgi:hypothetical protein
MVADTGRLPSLAKEELNPEQNGMWGIFHGTYAHIQYTYTNYG